MGTMAEQPKPRRLNLKKDEKLEIEWADGETSVYSIGYLRSMCPCAQCKGVREQQASKPKSRSLTVLPGNYTGPVTVETAELVGNYALKLVFSDQHDLGIYSFEYLRGIGKK